MSHSKSILLREHLQKLLDIDPASLHATRMEEFKHLESLGYDVDAEMFGMFDEWNNLTKRYVEMTNHFLRIHISSLDKRIARERVELVEQDNKRWTKARVMYRSSAYEREYRMLNVSKDIQGVIGARIGRYSDWKYPALEIGPGDAVWTKKLVAYDPLYIVDYNDEFLSTTKSAFNEKYGRRMRFYLNNGKSLSMLPQNQFGFVFSWNVFNYLPMCSIEIYLKEIWNVLRPGGVCMFSYNNAERSFCALRSEEKLMTFVPEAILTETIEKFGFDVLKTENEDSTVSWVEFQKPGKLKSCRTSQTLGKIILRHHVNA